MGDDLNIRQTRYRYLRISNKDRLPQSRSASDFVVDLQNDSAIHLCKEMFIQSVTLPHVFYNIHNGTNTLRFETNLDGVIDITIPDGFYSTSALMSYLQTTITGLITGAVVITQDPITKLITFVPDSVTINIKSITDEPINSTLSPLLGNNTTQALTASLTLDAMPSLQGEQYIFLHSKDIAPGQTRLTSSNAVSSFCSIPVKVPFRSVITYETSGDAVDHIVFRSEADLSTVRIKVRAQNGRLLDLKDNHELIIILKIFY